MECWCLVSASIVVLIKSLKHDGRQFSGADRSDLIVIRSLGSIYNLYKSINNG